MKLFTVQKDTDKAKKVVLDDMILTADMPTAAGSRMLDGYMSLLSATVAEKLTECGWGICGKANVGEMAIDLLGESSYYGASVNEEGKLVLPAAEIVKQGKALGAIVLDVNGAPMRAAAQSGLVYVKPTYGTVSRYGTVSAACSGECVGVMTKSVSKTEELLSTVNGHDDRDGTSHSESTCREALSAKEIKGRVAVAAAMTKNIDKETAERLNDVKAALAAKGIAVEEIDGELLTYARIAWNILMCSELCNNVSKYDGVKYGYRSKNYTTIGELYTNSRTEAFGELLKTAILFGSDNLSTENYMRMYDKALRVRRVISEYFSELFDKYDAILMPAASVAAYTEDDVKSNKYLCFEENLYTAPAALTGMPAVAVGGVQLVGEPFSDGRLLELAKFLEGGVR